MPEKVFFVEDPDDYPAGLMRISGNNRELADLYVANDHLIQHKDSTDPKTAQWAISAQREVRSAIILHEVELAKVQPSVITDKK